MANNIWTILDDYETCTNTDMHCQVVILNDKGQKFVEDTDCGWAMKQITYYNAEIDIEDDDGEVIESVPAESLVDAKISIRQLLDCWNEKHGTTY